MFILDRILIVYVNVLDRCIGSGLFLFTRLLLLQIIDTTYRRGLSFKPDQEVYNIVKEGYSKSMKLRIVEGPQQIFIVNVDDLQEEENDFQEEEDVDNLQEEEPCKQEEPAPNTPVENVNVHNQDPVEDKHDFPAGSKVQCSTLRGRKGTILSDHGEYLLVTESEEENTPKAKFLPEYTRIDGTYVHTQRRTNDKVTYTLRQDITNIVAGKEVHYVKRYNNCQWRIFQPERSTNVFAIHVDNLECEE
jgi:hypothetical protein